MFAIWLSKETINTPNRNQPIKPSITVTYLVKLNPLTGTCPKPSVENELRLNMTAFRERINIR